MAGPTSPPSAKPCSKRKITTSTGAAQPMFSKDGVSTIPRIEKPISPKQNSIAGLRPMRSPKGPITMPPSGRVRNPTPKTNRVCSRLVVESWLGKNTAPICTAKKPKIRKS